MCKKEKGENKMNTKLVENLQYITLVALITAQCVVGANFYVGQAVYLLANTIAVFRDFALGRTTADKVKDVACFAITLGLIGFRYFLG